MAGDTNNEILKAMADSVDPAGATTEREFNNDLLKRIAGGIGGIVKPSTGKVDATKIDGVIPAANLPSYVDDVIEGYLSQGAFYADQAHQTQIEPETGKIYVDLSADTSYRWGGSAYVAIGRTLDAASQAEAEAGQDNAKYMTALRTKQAIDYLTPTYSDVVASTSGQGGFHGLMTASDKEKLDGIAAGAGTNDLGITGASAGQFVKVSSVDSNGKPTSWAVEGPLTPEDREAIAQLINNPEIVSADAPTAITLEDNTEYHLTNVSDLTITYPSGAFDCWLSISTASGTVTVSLPSSSYIGDPPTFGPSETWELSIRNGVVVAGKAVPDAS